MLTSKVVPLTFALLFSSSFVYGDIDYTKDPKPAKLAPRNLGLETQEISPKGRMKYARVAVSSDPSGAYIHGEDGDYWGMITSGRWLEKTLEAQEWEPNSRQYIIMAQKPGYGDAKHIITLQYQWDWAQKLHYVVIVLQPRR